MTGKEFRVLLEPEVVLSRATTHQENTMGPR